MLMRNFFPAQMNSRVVKYSWKKTFWAKGWVGYGTDTAPSAELSFLPPLPSQTKKRVSISSAAGPVPVCVRWGGNFVQRGFPSRT